MFEGRIPDGRRISDCHDVDQNSNSKPRLIFYFNRFKFLKYKDKTNCKKIWNETKKNIFRTLCECARSIENFEFEVEILETENEWVKCQD